LVTELGQEEESVTRLSRVGFDNLVGHLAGLKLGKQAKKPMLYIELPDAFADSENRRK
jgi:hypothetical protein